MNQISHNDLKDRIRKSGDFTAVQKRYLERLLDEAEPVRHGRWVYDPNGYDWNLGAYVCSECACRNNNLPGDRKHNPYLFAGSEYCPNCGARMDGGNNENHSDDD